MTSVQYVPPPIGAPEQELVEWANALPAAGALGVTCTSLSPTLGVFVVADVPMPPNPNGAVHGGVLSAIADQCLGVVSVINAPRDQASVTASLHGQFHRPAFPPLTVRSRLISKGSRVIFVELEAEDGRGRRCATFQATMVVGGAERRNGAG